MAILYTEIEVPPKLTQFFWYAGTRDYFQTNFIHCSESCWTTEAAMLILSPFILILFGNIATHYGGW